MACLVGSIENYMKVPQYYLTLRLHVEFEPGHITCGKHYQDETFSFKSQ